MYRETDDTSIYVINLVIAELASSSAAVGAVSRVYYSKEKKNKRSTSFSFTKQMLNASVIDIKKKRRFFKKIISR